MINHGLYGSHGWGAEILQALPAKCGRDRIVAAVPRQFSGHRMFNAARRTLVATLSQQFMTKETTR